MALVLNAGILVGRTPCMLEHVNYSYTSSSSVHKVVALCVMSHSWCGGQMATGARVEVRMGRTRTAGRWYRPVYPVSSLQTRPRAPALLVFSDALSIQQMTCPSLHVALSLSFTVYFLFHRDRGWICSVCGLFHSEGVNHLEWQQRKQLSLSCDKFE